MKKKLNKILRNSSFLSSISWFEKTQCGVAKGKENILKHISGCADFTPRPPTAEMSSTILLSWAWLQWLLLNIQRISATQDCIHKHNRGGPLFCYRLNICCFLHAFLKRFTSFLLEKPQQRSANVATMWMCVRMRVAAAECAYCAVQQPGDEAEDEQWDEDSRRQVGTFVHWRHSARRMWSWMVIWLIINLMSERLGYVV